MSLNCPTPGMALLSQRGSVTVAAILFLVCVTVSARGNVISTGVDTSDRVETNDGVDAGAVVEGKPPATRSWGGINLQVGAGIGEQYIRTGLNYESPSLWGVDMGCFGRMDLSLEVGFAYWRNSGVETGHDELFQGTVLPLIRWWVFECFFFEGGIGPSIFSNNAFMGKDISTHFQFADHIGGGVRLTDSLLFSVRYAHFSNGGIRTPNPGLNIIMASVTYEF